MEISTEMTTRFPSAMRAGLTGCGTHLKAAIQARRTALASSPAGQGTPESGVALAALTRCALPTGCRPAYEVAQECLASAGRDRAWSICAPALERLANCHGRLLVVAVDLVSDAADRP